MKQPYESFLEKNKELLGDDGFAALRRDLEDSEKAEVYSKADPAKKQKKNARLR
jgi:hypothetical protein